MIRGINQQNIFSDDEDYEKYLDILATYRKKIEYDLYAYCLMRNHHSFVNQRRKRSPFKYHETNRNKLCLLVQLAV